MTTWPTPTTLRQLRGFLGLTGYYRRFVRNYAVIAAPLTYLLRKDAFAWSSEAEEAFTALKHAMSSAPVLKLADFDKVFIVETDASGTGIGAVLLQEGHPIAFFSKKLGPKRLMASTYHKELYAVVEAVQKWRQYLLGREFIVRSDQKSLRELLHQVIQTPEQQFYVRKLMGFKFRIEYKIGSSNRVADALSRREEQAALAEFLPLFCRPPPLFLDTLRMENTTLPDLLTHHKAAEKNELTPPFAIHDGLVYYNHRLCIGANSTLKQALIQECHSTLMSGHPGILRTFHRLAQSFYWPKMRQDVRRFVQSCFICQTTKYSTQPPAGLLQPLPIPTKVWDKASLDFIVGLPPSRGYTAILVVVDRLTKYSHFGALPTNYDAPKVAQLFLDIVVRHHGFPTQLLSDRDTIFLSNFWDELFRLSGTTLQHSTAYHPQTDGQTEVINRSLEQYLRAFTHDRPHRWSQLLLWAEYALNTTYNESIKMSPFQALYGRAPPSILPYTDNSSPLPAVDHLLKERDVLLRTLRDNILEAQRRMQNSANKKRREVEFNVGDMVLLKLQPYRQFSVAKPISVKLSRRFYGPFKILARIGKVAYRLELPDDARIHNVFHVSLLRQFVPSIDNPSPTPLTLPREFIGGRPASRPLEILDVRTVLRNNLSEEQWLISWSDGTHADATWEPSSAIRNHFPDLHLADKVALDVSGNDTATMEEAATMEEELEPPNPETDATTIMEEIEPPIMEPRRSYRNRRVPARFRNDD